MAEAPLSISCNSPSEKLSIPGCKEVNPDCASRASSASETEDLISQKMSKRFS